VLGERIRGTGALRLAPQLRGGSQPNEPGDAKWGQYLERLNEDAFECASSPTAQTQLPCENLDDGTVDVITAEVERLEREIADAAKGRKALSFAGRPLAHLDNPVIPLLPWEQAAVNETRRKLTHRFDPDWGDFWESHHASRVMSWPQVPGSSLGDLTVYVPGVGNGVKSPAQVFYEARHSGRYVIAHGNPTDPKANTPRVATHVDGVPVPPELQGKIWEIGSSQGISISFMQSADVLIEQLDTLRQHPSFSDVDFVNGKSHITLVGHSSGGVAAGLVRKRFTEELGLPNAISEVIAYGAPHEGSQPMNSGMYVPYSTAIGSTLGPQALAATITLAGVYMDDYWTWGDARRYVDLNVLGVIPRVGVGRWHPEFQATAYSLPFFGNFFDGDGLVDEYSARRGKQWHQVVEDHVNLNGNPMLARQMLEIRAGIRRPNHPPSATQPTARRLCYGGRP
jgi:hypothetical protein